MLCINCQSFSQPVFTLNVTAGYSQPMGDFNNGISLHDTAYASWPYLMRSGYNIGVTGKYSVNKDRNIKIVLGLNYNGFKNWGDIENSSGDIVQFLPKVAILNLSLGGEYSFKPKSDINPFAGIDFTTNFFSGSFQTNPTSNFPRSQLKAETRFGFEFGGGVDFTFSKYVGGILGVKYNLSNVFGKGDDESADTNKVYLGDNAQGNQSSRNISYVQFYAGVSFFWGNLKK